MADGTQADDAPEATLPEQYEIPNVHAFQARPTLFTTYGRAVDVQFEPAQVAELLKNRAVTVHLEGKDDTLEPRSSSARTMAYAAGTEPTGADSLMRSALAAEPLTALVEAPSTEPTAETTPQLATTTSYEPPEPETRPKPPAVGFHVPYQQTPTPLGYSRGALLNTIALAPRKDTTIELFTWDRHTNALEQTSTSEVEQNIESTDATKDTTQVVNELAHDRNFKASAVRSGRGATTRTRTCATC